MRFSSHLSSRFIISAVAVLVLALVAQAQHLSQAQPLGKDQLITPEELLKTIQSSGPKPLILNVGPSMLYMQAHIPGAEFIGPGSEPQGIQALKQRVKSLPKTTSIVLYCGCCPWAHCPNVEPAYRQLRSMGFTKVKVLYIATNLGVDWVYKGYPTVR
jgi:thiosulfate/3-mercaptopyruvate sulfurtransferase